MAYSDSEILLVAASIGRHPTESHGSSAQAQTANRDKEFQFPTKLYEMLEIVDSLGLSHTVSWLPHGRSFQVKDPDQFMDLVVPQFFKATKYRSFQRQLNLWGFQRIVKGQKQGNGVWYHEYFIRGNPELIPNIIRTRIKGKKTPSQHRDKPRETQNYHLVHASELVSEEDVECVYEDSSCVSDDTRQICNTRSPLVSPNFLESFEIEDRLSEWGYSAEFSAPCRRSGSADNKDVILMYLEPLPLHSAGILDGNKNNCELAEFGQLLHCLM
mmetsp:Transcript_18564/g.26401  ORF Transcript_18564/g.26401 Transcript_18564/m.26401 type:complete len:271 (+) Transcript_18564:61-873(+)